jgi:hypothetical protein
MINTLELNSIGPKILINTVKLNLVPKYQKHILRLKFLIKWIKVLIKTSLKLLFRKRIKIQFFEEISRTSFFSKINTINYSLSYIGEKKSPIPKIISPREFRLGENLPLAENSRYD